MDELLRHPAIWRAGQPVAAPYETLATGFPVLDEALPGGGWPVGALTEILSAAEGIGELRLLMPALARLSGEGRWIMWIAPPYVPYAPALIHQGMDLSRVLWVRAGTETDSLWAGEQALRSRACGAVLLWPHPGTPDERSLRRLQLAAEDGKSWGLLFRTPETARRHSPAALRLSLEPLRQGVLARILKCRGRGPSGPLPIYFS